MLYEVLTGHAPFTAETISDTLAAVLKEEPDWRELPAAPLGMQRLVRRCLKKDPTSRLHDIADARLELEESVNESSALVVPMPGHGSWRISKRHAAGGILLALVVVASIVGAWNIGRQQAGPAGQSRFVVPLPSGFALENGPGPALVVSPDGLRMVFVALERGGGTQLFSRALDRFEAVPIPNTSGASAPFFSPDGRWVGFYAGGALHRVAIDGGAPLKIADAPAVWSAAWGPDDSIVFATAVAPNGLRRVAADGGTPEELTIPKSDAGRAAACVPAGPARRRSRALQHSHEGRLAARRAHAGDARLAGAAARRAGLYARALRLERTPDLRAGQRRPRRGAVRRDARRAHRIRHPAARADRHRPRRLRVRGLAPPARSSTCPAAPSCRAGRW